MPGPRKGPVGRFEDARGRLADVTKIAEDAREGTSEPQRRSENFLELSHGVTVSFHEAAARDFHKRGKSRASTIRDAQKTEFPAQRSFRGAQRSPKEPEEPKGARGAQRSSEEPKEEPQRL